MKTRKDYEQELTYAIARHADAVERDRVIADAKPRRNHRHRRYPRVATFAPLNPHNLRPAKLRHLGQLVDAVAKLQALLPQSTTKATA